MTSSVHSRLATTLADRYAIRHELGAGGMATVYLAHDIRHNRDVALKVLREDLAASLGKERFLREIQLAAKLSHPHILPLFDSGEVDGMLYYVMPKVSGQSLRERLDKEGMLPVDQAVRIATEVAGALEHAHRLGVIHRDIKPENIMFQDGHSLVTDFGIGKAMSDVANTALTQTGTSVGTPAYMSPEQAVGDEVDGRSDIYSLGCVLYEMLAGEQPFTGPTVQAVIAKRFVQTPADVTALREGIPRPVGRAVQKALARAPVDRHDTAAMFVVALGEVETGHSHAAVADKSIVVLPFENMSSDRDTDYFADGISEEIINALTQCTALRVAARTSSFAFKGKHEDLRVVAEKLGVRHVLEGSVRKAGNRLRITAQLIDASNGYHLWSEKYDRDMDDIFAIQDEIATVIADKLQVTLNAGDAARPAAANVAAYDQYLKGMAFLRRRGASILDGIDCFRQATASDPEYAPAHAGLAHGLALAIFWGIVPPEEGGEAAREAAARAMALEPNLVASQVAAALVAINIDLDRAKAAIHWDRARELGPADIEARANRAVFHLCYAKGDFDAAIVELRQAQALDPLNHFLLSQLGLVFDFGDRPLEGEAVARDAIAMDGSTFYPNWILLMALEAQGKHQAALDLGLSICRRFGRSNWTLFGLASIYASLGRAMEAKAIYAELMARSQTEYVQPATLALAAMSAGHREEAVGWMQRAADRRDPLLLVVVFYLRMSSAVALRGTPEHEKIVRQLGWDRPLAHST